MAVKMIDSGDYEFSLPDDTGDPKTVFVVKPLDQFEFLRMSAVFGRIAGSLDAKGEGKGFFDFLASADSEGFQRAYERFMGEHIIEIRNIRNPQGKLVTVKGAEVDPKVIGPMDGFVIFSDAIGRVAVAGQERKN